MPKQPVYSIQARNAAMAKVRELRKQGKPITHAIYRVAQESGIPENSLKGLWYGRPAQKFVTIRQRRGGL